MDEHNNKSVKYALVKGNAQPFSGLDRIESHRHNHRFRCADIRKIERGLQRLFSVVSLPVQNNPQLSFLQAGFLWSNNERLLIQYYFFACLKERRFDLWE